MKFAKNVIVAVGMTDDVFKLLAPLRDMSFLSHTEVHFVHIYKTVNYTSYLGDFPSPFPAEEERASVRESIETLLRKLSTEVLPISFEGKVHHQCLFGEGPKYKLCDYIQEVNADLVIIPTRKKHDLFESSFAQFLSKHSSSSVLILKDHRSEKREQV